MADSEPPPKKRRVRKNILTGSEKKRREIARQDNKQKTRVYLGKEAERWRQIKRDAGLRTDVAMAKFLMDYYCFKAKTEPQKFSTPISMTLNKVIDSTPSVSEISQVESERERPMSGMEEIYSSSEEVIIKDPEISKKILGPKVQLTSAGRQVISKPLTDSFVDPFNLSIELSEENDESGEEGLESDDDDYEPSILLTAVLPDEVNNAANEVSFEEVEFNLEEEVEEEEETEESDTYEEGLVTVASKEECVQLAKAEKCIVFVKQLLSLASYGTFMCSTCTSPVSMEHKFIGSAIYIKWICGQKHVVHQWCSQPLLNRRVHSGDFLICSTILTSGNNYSKLILWANQLKLKFPSAQRFHSIQREYVLPAIDMAWNNNVNDVIDSIKDQDIVLLGDGRNDSPGYCAQYCSYTLMDLNTKKIVSLKTVDKRQTGCKSVNMEKQGFITAINNALDLGLRVREVVTDAHTGITAVMKKDYQDIKHSYDIWHVAKNLGKKLVKISQKKQNSILINWNRDIINHFWFSCQKAENYSEFIGIWRSVLHHITNKHEWVGISGGGVTKCFHGAIDSDRDKPWLHPSKHHYILKDLAEVVLDKRLLKKVDYFLNFRSTADLEVFHQHILMYCAKRYAYTPPVYRARNLLAALDHNNNAGRAILKNKDGTTRYHRHYNKKSGRWSVYPCKEKKSYLYVDDILTNALYKRITEKKGMYRRITLSPSDPRMISRTLAPLEPPPTQQLVEQHKSRFST